MRELADRPNAVCKISGLGLPFWGFRFRQENPAGWLSGLAEAWRPYVETAVDLFGAERCMMGSDDPVPRNYSITPTRVPADIRDASHPAPIWRAPRGARRSDGGFVVLQTTRPPVVGPARPDRAPCAGVRGCNDPPMPSGSIAGATPIAVSTSPGTRAESYRSLVRRSHWPSGCAAAT